MATVKPFLAIPDAGDQIIAIGTEALTAGAVNVKATVEELGRFILNHEPGHLSGLFDDQRFKNADGTKGEVMPLMTSGNEQVRQIQKEGKKLSDFVSDGNLQCLIYWVRKLQLCANPNLFN